MVSTTPTLTMLNLGPGSIIAQRYEVCERIGSGGMGLVFRVIDRDLNDQIVALKLLHPHLAQDDQLFKRFRNEVLIARTLSHPNIVRLHDIGRAEGGFSYISMEFVDGCSLRDRIEAGMSATRPEGVKSLTFEEGQVILYYILSAVAYAHGKDVVHRDLKPANVLLTKSDEVKLADFGTARISGMNTSLTQTGQVIGTPDYMSPEQIRGDALDASCDIYALGIMAYEIATGRRPFSAESPVALAFKHLSEPIPPFSGGSSGVPGWYEEMVFRATAKTKEQRFATVVDFARFLIDHSPAVAKLAGAYSVTASQFVSGTQSVSAIKAEPQASSKAVHPSSDSRTTGDLRDGRFEMGKSSSVATTSDSWKLDLGPLREGESDRISAAPSGSLNRKDNSNSNIILILSMFLFFGAVALLFFASDLPLFVSMREAVLGHKEASQQTAKIGAKVSTGSAASAPEVVAPVSPSVESTKADLEVASANGGVLEKEAIEREAKERAQLEAELLNGAPTESAVQGETSGKNTETGDGATTAGVDKTPEELPPPTEAAQEKPSAEKVDADTTPVPPAVPKSDTVVQAPGTEVKAPLKISSVSMAFERETGERISGTVSRGDLRSLSWIASVQGVSRPSESEHDALLKKVTVNVFDPKGARVIAKIPAATFGVTGAASVDFRGSLRRLESVALSAGEYRFDFIFGGEVYNSSYLSIYTVNDKPGGSSGSTAVTPGGTVVQVPQSDMENSGSRRVPPTNNNAVTAATAYPVASGNSRLPPAAGSSMDPVDRAPVESVEPVNRPTVSESYRGVATLMGAAGEERRSLVLNLDIVADSEISGTAQLEGYGDFQAQGKIYPRGVEITLQNEKLGARLTGSRRKGESMRGPISIPSLQIRGTWDARLAQ